MFFNGEGLGEVSVPLRMYCSLLTMELLPVVHTLSLSASHHTGPSALLEVLRSENKTIHVFKWRNRHSAGTAALGHNRWRAELLPLSRQEKDCRVEAMVLQPALRRTVSLHTIQARQGILQSIYKAERMQQACCI